MNNNCCFWPNSQHKTTFFSYKFFCSLLIHNFCSCFGIFCKSLKFSSPIGSTIAVRMTWNLNELRSYFDLNAFNRNPTEQFNPISLTLTKKKFTRDFPFLFTSYRVKIFSATEELFSRSHLLLWYFDAMWKRMRLPVDQWKVLSDWNCVYEGMRERKGKNGKVTRKCKQQKYVSM